MVWMEEDEVCDEEEDVEELDEMGAEEPHSSLQSGHVCRSESGNEAICSVTETQDQFTTPAAMRLWYLLEDTSALCAAQKIMWKLR